VTIEEGIGDTNMLEIVLVELDKLKFYLPESLLYKINNPDAEFLFHIGIVLLVIVLIVLLIVWKMGQKVKENIPENLKKRAIAAKEFVLPSSGQRFRKRDTIAFMGKKMVKKVKAAGSYIRGGKGQKRRAIAKLARRFLGQQGSPESVGGGVRGAMPLEYLEEDYEAGVDALPQQLRFVLQNMRVFGNFEQPIFLELVKQIEYMSVPANQYLFKVGDPDENIFIVQSGQLNVTATEGEMTSTLKHVKPGDAIMSLLSFLDHLARTMGKPRLESVNDVVELVVESPAWNKKECNEKQLEEMDPTFREELEEAFRLFDREGDGQIETQELSNLLWSLGLQPSREEVESLLLEMDSDRSGTVDVEEFLLAMARVLDERNAKDEVGEVFAMIDQDRDGVISREDIATTLLSLGQQVTDQQVSAMLTAAGDDTKITLLDFQNVTRDVFSQLQSL